MCRPLEETGAPTSFILINQYSRLPNFIKDPCANLSRATLESVYTAVTDTTAVSQVKVPDLPSSSSPPPLSTEMDGAQDPERADTLEQFKRKLLESRECEAKLKALRLDIKGLQHEFDTTEDNIKALQSVGQIIGEVLKQLDEERCKLTISGLITVLPS